MSRAYDLMHVGLMTSLSVCLCERKSGSCELQKMNMWKETHSYVRLHVSFDW